MRACPILPVMLAVAVAATPLPAAYAQASLEPIWLEWLEALDRHVPGELDEPARRAAPWSRGDLESILRAWSREDPVNQPRLLRRALVFHVDIAVLSRTAEGYRLPPDSDGLAIIEDGQAIGQMSATAHWEFARTLLDRSRDDRRREDRLRVGRVFYRATAAMLQFWGENPELTLHLEAGRRLLKDDAVLLLYEGTQWQTYAGPRAQRYFDERRRERALGPLARPLASVAGQQSRPVTREAAAPEVLPSADHARDEAERLFRRAIAVDPAAIEARIRLAHVLSDDGRLDAAAAELEKAPVPTASRFLDFYATLLAGRIERARGRFEAARAAFERAASIYPNAPSPQLGLSELALVEGRGGEALARLTGRARAERVEQDDPWWWLERVHEPSAEALIEAMRREFSQ